ncbi:MAG: hypothetical protein MZU84_06730 [Sphingobacterium sp.]|nr:hypothetical protein [Sphingobacterium sp.]
MKEGTAMLEKTNLLGAVTAIAFFVSAIMVFTFRLLGRPQYGHWIGYFEFLLAIPLIFLLLQARQLGRPALYYIQIGCMLAWLVLEALLDYILKIDFRNVRWIVISYVVLFFAGTGGLLGVAANARARMEHPSDHPVPDHGSVDLRATRRYRHVERSSVHG